MLFPKPSLFPKKMGEARVKLKKLYVMTMTNKNHMTDYSGAKLIPLLPKKFNFLNCQKQFLSVSRWHKKFQTGSIDLIHRTE